MNGRSDPWHLDKRVPIALILALCIQTVGAVWWAATITSTVGELTVKIDAISSGDRRQWDEINAEKVRMNALSNRISRMEGILEHIARQNERILQKLDGKQ